MIFVNEKIAIHEWEITETFARSSGPGGQNVNKVNTSVVLRFEAETSPSLSISVKRRLQRLAGRRWTNDGAIVIQVEETRSQLRNREIARQRLKELIRESTNEPKRRISTKPTKGSKERRLKSKKVRSEVKAVRGNQITRFTE